MIPRVTPEGMLFGKPVSTRRVKPEGMLFRLMVVTSSRKIGQYMLAQQMPEGRQPIGRSLQSAGEFEHR